MIKSMVSTLPFRLLIAWFCIISTLLMLVLVRRSQTTSAYYSIGLHKLVYASSLASFGALYTRCLMPPSIFRLGAFFFCVSNLRSDWIVTPRYLMLSVYSRVVLPSLLKFIERTGFPKPIAWHFILLKDIFQSIDLLETALFFRIQWHHLNF